MAEEALGSNANTADTRLSYGSLVEMTTAAASTDPGVEDEVTTLRRRPLVSCAAVLLSTGVLSGLAVGAPAAVFSRAKHSAPTVTESLAVTDSTEGLYISLATEYYGKVSSRDDYPWPVVEPYRGTILSAEGSLAMNYSRATTNGDVGVFHWTVTKYGSEGDRTISPSNHANLTGTNLTYHFEHVGATYVVKLTVRSKNNLTIVGVAEEVVRCKYVKREVRTLTRPDHEALFHAYEEVYRVDEDKGRAKYGENFRPIDYFVRKHLDRMTLLGCTPYHNSEVFITAHMALNLEFDLALQSVDKTVVNGYWDYTIDDATFGDEWYNRSEIFTDKFFGSDPDGGRGSNDGDSHILRSGHFAYLPIAKDYNAAEHNVFGRVTDACNYNPSGYVQRASTISGLPTRVRLPGCQIVKGALAASSLESFHHIIETYFHAELHVAIGGAWGSQVNLRDAVDKATLRCANETLYNHTVDGAHYSACELVKYIQDISVNMNTVMRTAFDAFMSTDATKQDHSWYACPDTKECENADGKPGTCTCFSPILRAAKQGNETLSMSAIYTMLDELGLLSVFGDRYGSSTVDDGTYENITLTSPVWGAFNETVNETVKIYQWKHVSKSDSELLWRLFADYLADPPRFGPMSATLASPNDPIFWVTHNAWERIWHTKLLESESTFDMAWSNASDSCWGRNYHSVLPFRNLFNDSRVHDYTNEELLEAFKPHNPELPYVYESLAFEHCGEEEINHDLIGSDEPGAWPRLSELMAMEEGVRRVFQRGDVAADLWKQKLTRRRTQRS